MELVLVRHGRPRIHRATEGIADPSLDDYGRWQAERVSAWLAHEPIDAILVSPKARASETVQPLIDHTGLEAQVISDLDEIDRGSSCYYPTDILPTEGRELWDKILAGQWDEIGYDRPEVFTARIQAAFDDLVARPRGAHVVVGCHSGTIRAILASVIGEKVPGFSFSLEFGSISRVQVGEHGPRVLSVNETGHFDADRVARRGAMNTAANVE